MRKFIYISIFILPVLFLLNCSQKANPVTPTISGGASEGIINGSGTDKSKRTYTLKVTGSIKVQNNDRENYSIKIHIYDAITSTEIATRYGNYDKETKTFTPYNYSSSVSSYGVVKVKVELVTISTTDFGTYVLSPDVVNTIVLSGSVE